MDLLVTLVVFAAAALGEIAGCFSFWAWLRMERSALWIAPGVLGLMAFAWLLTRVDAPFAGRAYAAYGGIYIATSLGWLWGIEGVRPDRWDWFGAGLCVVGASVILFGRKLTMD
jgi:small multidrug resistance family-3 protein